MIQFNNKRGLCAAAKTMYGSNENLEKNVLQELGNQFRNAGLPRLYPFNVYRYIEHKNNGTQHLCPQRLAWVRDHIMYPPADQSKELTEFYIAWFDWAVSETNEGDLNATSKP